MAIGNQSTAQVSNCDWTVQTYLQDIDTLPRDVAVNLVLVVEMPTVHLGRLVHCMFNLHRDTTTGLGLLDKLRKEKKGDV